MAPVLGHTASHCAVKIGEAVPTDAGFRIRRDVGRVDCAEWRSHFETTSKRLPASDRVTGDTIRGTRHVFVPTLWEIGAAWLPDTGGIWRPRKIEHYPAHAQQYQSAKQERPRTDVHG